MNQEELDARIKVRNLSLKLTPVERSALFRFLVACLPPDEIVHAIRIERISRVVTEIGTELLK